MGQLLQVARSVQVKRSGLEIPQKVVTPPNYEQRQKILQSQPSLAL